MRLFKNKCQSSTELKESKFDNTGKKFTPEIRPFSAQVFNKSLNFSLKMFF